MIIKQTGFTLIELAVVLFLVSLVMMVAVELLRRRGERLRSGSP